MVLSDFTLQLITMGAIALLVFIFFAWFFRGFLFPYMRVRSSRGGKVLIKVRNPLVDYYAVGRPEGKVIKTKLRNKVEVVLSVPSNAFYRTLGVVCVDIDEESGAVVTRDYNIVSSLDPVIFNNLLMREKTAPHLSSKKDLIVIILLCVIILGVIITIFLLTGIKAQLEQGVAGTITGVAL